MGYNSLKFPPVTSLFIEPLSIQTFFPYWLIAIYLLSAVWLIPQLVICKHANRSLIPFAILVMGLFLFRSALGRSDFYHFYFAAQPVFILFFILVDQIVLSIKINSERKTVHLSTAIIIFAIIFSLPYLFSNYRENAIWPFVRQGLDVTSKFTLQNDKQEFMADITGGVPIGNDLIDSIDKIHGFLEHNTSSDEYVYFYPNQAGYYFLFNRRSPTRYALSYQAITTEQRLEIIKELETNKPRFVICSPNAWLIDNIPPNIQVPELHEYISKKYTLYEDMSDVLVMSRKD